MRSIPFSFLTISWVNLMISIRSHGRQDSPSLIRKFAWIGDQWAQPRWYHLSQTDSMSIPADISREGFLKKLPQQFPFGCLFSRKSITSISDAYFSIFSERSNHTSIKNKSGLSLRYECRYENPISSFGRFWRTQVCILKTVAREKLDSVSNPKQPAFQNTAPHIDPGSQINRCQIGWLYSISSVSDISQIDALVFAWSIFFSSLYSQPTIEFFITIHSNRDFENRIFVPHQIIRNGSFFSWEKIYASWSFWRSFSVVISKK